MNYIFNGYSDSKGGRVPVGINTAWKGWSSIPYKDADLDIKFNVNYKKTTGLGDTNYKDGAPVGDIVKYGQDYKYANAIPLTGSQPVYTVTVTDNKTKMQVGADLITTMQFKTVGALFVRGTVSIHKDGLANDENIWFQSGDANMPALVTTKPKGPNVWIQHVASKALATNTDCTNSSPNYNNIPPANPSGAAFECNLHR